MRAWLLAALFLSSPALAGNGTCTDEDGDGWCAQSPTECDDTDPNVHWDAEETAMASTTTATAPSTPPMPT